MYQLATPVLLAALYAATAAGAIAVAWWETRRTGEYQKPKQQEKSLWQ